MSTYVSDSVKQMAPWRKGITWWVVLLQGVALAALGCYGVWRSKDAGIIISLVLAALLVLQAFWVIVSALRGREFGMSVFNLLAAGGGFVAGLGILIPYFFQREALHLPTAWANFGMALIVVGLLTLASAFIERPNSGIAWNTLIRGLLELVLGAYIFFIAVSNNSGDAELIRWLAFVLLGAGALLILYALLLFLRRPRASAAAPVA